MLALLSSNPVALADFLNFLEHESLLVPWSLASTCIYKIASGGRK